jgi:predicted Na+-dependent transporter
MSELLDALSSLFTLAFSFTTMLSMGLGLTVAEIVRPLRNLRFVAAALAVNLLLVPALAMVLASALGLSTDLRIGLLLLAAAPGAPMLPKLVQIARGDAATAVALTALLIVATVVFLPLALPILLPGAVVDSGGIATSLATQMLLPLAVGVFVRERYEEEAAAYRPTVAQISSVTLALLFVTSLGQNLPGVLGLVGTGGILATGLLIAAAVLVGHLAAVPGGVERRVMALGAGQRNMAAAFVVATANFADRPGVLTFLATAGLIAMVILFPLAGEFGKRPRRAEEGGRREATAGAAP